MSSCGQDGVDDAGAQDLDVHGHVALAGGVLLLGASAPRTCCRATSSSTLYLPAIPPLALIASKYDLVAGGQRVADDRGAAGERA